MRLFAYKIIICVVVLYVKTCSSQTDDANEDGFLNVTCNQAQDCYVLEDSSYGLHLACWHDVHKCKCDNTFRSNFHLKWQNGQCLMSKYGPCGDKGNGLAVGCQDGFACIDNNCRDPNNAKSVRLTPFTFDESQCSEGDGCQFSDDLRLACNGENRCNCEKVYVADLRSTYWDIRNYDGDNTCSVGKFGPCGSKNGITIECHGNGITCVAGTCVNATHPISDAGEDCATIKNCKEGLQCSPDSVCIEPFSLAEGKRCSGDMQCQKDLKCRRNGPWSSAFCQQDSISL